MIGDVLNSAECADRAVSQCQDDEYDQYSAVPPSHVITKLGGSPAAMTWDTANGSEPSKGWRWSDT
jgi:hypothetical protein